MALKLIITAAFQKNGNIVKVSVDGTYGFQLALSSSIAVVHITLVRLLKIRSTGPIYVTTTLVEKSYVEITKEGRISQDGSSVNPVTSPVIYSEKISNGSFIRAQVIVDLWRKGKLIASEFVYL